MDTKPDKYCRQFSNRHTDIIRVHQSDYFLRYSNRSILGKEKPGIGGNVEMPIENAIEQGYLFEIFT